MRPVEDDLLRGHCGHTDLDSGRANLLLHLLLEFVQYMQVFIACRLGWPEAPLLWLAREGEREAPRQLSFGRNAYGRYRRGGGDVDVLLTSLLLCDILFLWH